MNSKVLILVANPVQMYFYVFIYCEDNTFLKSLLCFVGLDNPLVASILDGSALRMFLEDEDDFAMIAENLFTDLDTEDKGMISKREIRNAVVNMGVEMGVPPLEGFLPFPSYFLSHLCMHLYNLSTVAI
jgi:hypothetical protein